MCILSGMALASLAGVLVLSALLGLAIYLLLRKIKGRWLRLALSALAALLVLSAVGIVLLAIGDAPATNEPVGSQQKIVIDIGHSQRSGQTPRATRIPDMPTNRGEPARSLEEVEIRQTIVIFFKNSLKPHEDFTFLVSISSAAGSQPSGKHFALLSAPPSAKLRTSDRCEDAAGQHGDGMACATSDGTSFRVAWDVTTTDSGILLFTLTLPSTLVLSPTLADEKWRAKISGIGIPGPTSGGWPGYVILKPEQPYVQWSGGSVDLGSRQIRVPIEVVTTLGVTRQTFTILAYAGAALSAFLGSGWIWQLLVWLRREKANKTVLLKP